MPRNQKNFFVFWLPLFGNIDCRYIMIQLWFFTA
jgi:hypothetical protein